LGGFIGDLLRDFGQLVGFIGQDKVSFTVDTAISDAYYNQSARQGTVPHPRCYSPFGSLSVADVKTFSFYVILSLFGSHDERSGTGDSKIVNSGDSDGLVGFVLRRYRSSLVREPVHTL
jgi:hypothetical protein